jgi:two-component system KDP operon response regulator KdpE
MEAKIVTIDDEPAIRSLIRHALRKEPYKIFEAGNGDEGLKLIHEKLPDMVLLDVVMPEMNGLDTLVAIRQDAQIAHIPVLMLTGVKDSEKLKTALGNPRTDFLEKPFLLEMLQQKVREILKTYRAENAEKEE